MSNNIIETLEELGFRGVNFLKKPEWRKRAEEIKDYGEKNLIFLQYVIEGGYRDAKDFKNNYENCSPPKEYENSLTYKSEVKKAMLIMAQTQILNFVYCPFMKTRLFNLLNMDHPQIIQDSVCYVLNGVHKIDFKKTSEFELKKENYLKENVLLD